MELRHHNFTLDGSDIPLFAGDRWYGQDILRDFYNNKEYSSNILEDLLQNYSDNMVIYGITPSQGAGHTLSWTAGRIKGVHTLKTPTNWAALPPSMTSHTIPYIFDLPAAADQAITSAVTDGVTVNYAKVEFTESGTSSRTRAKKAGTYNSEVSESYTFTCDDTAPTSDEVAISTFLTDGTTIIFLNTETRWKFERNSGKRNFIINPDGALAQRGTTITAATTTVNNDDTYTLDQWILLSDGNDIVDVSRDTDAPNGSKYSIKSLVATANKKWAYLQIIENKETLRIVDKAVSIAFAAKTTTAKIINNIRVAVISWDGAADTVTSDVISAWAASGTNPTLVANWTYENTAVDIPLHTDWVTHYIEDIDIDTSSTTNVGLLIWVDDTDAAVGDELFLSQIRLVEGSEICKYEPRHISDEIILCQRYFEKSYDIDTTPGTVVGLGQYNFRLNGLNSANHSHALQVVYKVQKMKIPTVVCYNPTTGTAGQWQVTGGTRAAVASNVGEYAFNTELDLGGASDDAHYYGHYTIEAVL